MLLFAVVETAQVHQSAGEVPEGRQESSRFAGEVETEADTRVWTPGGAVTLADRMGGSSG